MPLFGIDVSSATVDWAKVKASGIGFGIAKATEGNGYTQPQIAANLKGMRAAGLVPGAYHFLVSDYAGATGAIQCDYFLSKVGDIADAIVALDVEEEPNLPKQPGIREVRSFAARFKQLHPNHPLLIYSGSWYWNSAPDPNTHLPRYMNNPVGSDLGPLWDSFYVATYGSVPAIYASMPAYYWTQNLYGGWTSKTLLQFTAHPTVPGVSGNVDASAFLGSVDELKRLLIDPSLPDTSTEAPTDLSNLTVLEAYTPDRPLHFDPGTYTGYKLDGTTHQVTIGGLGSSANVRAKCLLIQDPLRAPNGTFYFVADGGLGGYFLAVATAGLTLAAAPSIDCADAVNAAVAPLQTQISGLKTQVADINNQLTSLNQQVTALHADIAKKDAYIAAYPKG